MAKKTAQAEVLFLNGTKFKPRGIRRLDKLIEGMPYFERTCAALVHKIEENDRDTILDWVEIVAGAPHTNIGLWLARLVVHVADIKNVSPQSIIDVIAQTKSARALLFPKAQQAA